LSLLYCDIDAPENCGAWVALLLKLLLMSYFAAFMRGEGTSAKAHVFLSVNQAIIKLTIHANSDQSFTIEKTIK